MPSDFVITAGSSVYLAPHILSALMQPGDTVLVPEFTFYGTLNCILPLFHQMPGTEDCRAEIARTDWSDGGKITVDILERQIARADRPACSRGPTVLWLASPTNLGAIYSASELKMIAGFAHDHDLTVVCDEAFAGLTNRKPYVSPWAVDAFGDRLVCLGTTSKLFELYDGDHILYTDLAASGDIFTEDVNIWSGCVAYFMTRNTRARQAIWWAIADHPFTLTRAVFSSKIICATPEQHFEARNRDVDRNRDLSCTLISKLSGSIGLPLRSVGTPQSGVITSASNLTLLLSARPG